MWSDWKTKITYTSGWNECRWRCSGTLDVSLWARVDKPRTCWRACFHLSLELLGDIQGQLEEEVWSEPPHWNSRWKLKETLKCRFQPVTGSEPSFAHVDYEMGWHEGLARLQSICGWSTRWTVVWVALLKSLQVGERQQVLVTEESFDGQYYVAHNKFYEQVRKLLSISSPSVNFQKILHSTQSPVTDFGRNSSSSICNWWVCEARTQPTRGLLIFTLGKWDQRLCLACLRSRLCRWQQLKCV